MNEGWAGNSLRKGIELARVVPFFHQKEPAILRWQREAGPLEIAIYINDPVNGVYGEVRSETIQAAPGQSYALEVVMDGSGLRVTEKK